MLGAIAGDIIGSVYEHENVKATSFPLFRPSSRFTDDTVLTVAVADCLIHQANYAKKFEDYYYQYPNAGFGGGFQDWAGSREHKPYNSWGNGSAMRVSPVGFAFNDLQQVLDEAKRTAEITHNHPEGIKGAQATATAIFLARTGGTKAEIKRFVESSFGYDLSRTLDEIRPAYSFDISCQGTVPQAITAFLESNDFEDAIRKAISLGGDSDTLACITGGIAEAFYKKVPDAIAERVFQILDERLANVTRKFMAKFNLTTPPVKAREAENQA
jgi:ADP-ribosylglycohydrolase